MMRSECGRSLNTKGLGVPSRNGDGPNTGTDLTGIERRSDLTRMNRSSEVNP